MPQLVRIVELGPIEPFKLHELVVGLNDIQDEYDFRLDDALRNLPAPTVRDPNWRNLSPQYDPEALFSYINAHRPANGEILVGIIDTEVYHDLFSTTDRENRVVVVSIRVSGLQRILSSSRKTAEQYVALEIGAQLLCIQYRRRAGINADPRECEKPWHVERRNCLFDYYGLAEENTSKLISPRISEQVNADLIAAEVPGRLVHASMKIVERAASTLWSEVWRRLPSDPIFTIPLGIATGFLSSVMATTWLSSDYRFVLLGAGACILIMAGRVWRLKS